ncbi:uncharacterized protein Z518_08725 [Rhinocladiella mackenziei CBS 650.93]|uniref:FAD dependent oxidoreductase domain-containing protein n=1 Tax=Rhinocladiella mackenziei CBS 650.93 TaxID=1442369 RepID=A0A0D2GX47_9EURO|nr:uncharacterized protein Z518_08725 [Rhinocladiella mackenziei CBS 650.93]KIX02783.1 hypothetical protein Z518_08725 [Rhinocladiella mackenziei CBS 650.93]
MSTVILGGGIIGLSTAYCLSLKQPAQSVHIIDSSPTLFTSASGYAGGFLALDWFNPSVSSLGALSFRLHREWAEKHNGPRRWGYAGSHVYSLNVEDVGGGKGKTGKKARGEDWLLEGASRAGVARANSETDVHIVGSGGMVNDDGTPAVFTPHVGGTMETIAGPEECAQVEPREFCEFLLEECQCRHVQVHLSMRAVGVLTDGDGVLKGLKVQSTSTNGNSQDHDVKEVECRNVVIAAGAWTPRVFKTLFPESKVRIPIDPLAGHSIVVKSPRYKTPFIDASKRHIGGGEDNWLCYSIYCAPGQYWPYAPEAYARLARNGETEIWLGGLNSSTLPLPELAVDVKDMIDPKSIESLRKTTVQLAGRSKEGDEPNQDDLETVREALCFRPVSQSGNPIIGNVPEKDLGGVKLEDGGVWIASGHGPWGITLSPGTGLVMSEMILGQKTSADVTRLQIG